MSCGSITALSGESLMVHPHLNELRLRVADSAGRQLVSLRLDPELARALALALVDAQSHTVGRMPSAGQATPRSREHDRP